ncbi:MAG: hypothetical protein QW279_03285 [Candidatus Jordarchaeaceae archaeon]
MILIGSPIRYIFAFIVCLATMFGIIYFVAQGHTLMNLYTAFTLWQLPIPWISQAQTAAFWSNVKFAITDYLIRPYTLATSSPLTQPPQTFVPIAALTLGGFISGLITKHPFRAITIGIISSFIVGIGYLIGSVTGAISASTLSGIISGFTGIITNISGWDIALLFLLPATLGMIGGLITRDWRII